MGYLTARLIKYNFYEIIMCQQTSSKTILKITTKHKNVYQFD